MKGNTMRLFLTIFAAGNMEQVPRYDIKNGLKNMPMNTTFLPRFGVLSNS